MAKQDRNTLEAYFQAGDIPTQSQFAELIESQLNKPDDDIDKAVPSMGDLTGITTSDLTDGATVFVQNFYSDVRGGGDPFDYEADGDKADHNGITIIDPTHSTTPGQPGWWTSENTGTTGVFRRREKGYIDIRDGGVKSESSDQKNRLLGVFNAITRDKKCIITEDIYTSEIVIPTDTNIEFIGNARIIPINTTSTDFIEISSDCEIHNLNIFIESGKTVDKGLFIDGVSDIKINGSIDTTDQLSADGLFINNSSNIDVNDFSVNKFNNGTKIFNAPSGSDIKINRLEVSNFVTALYLRNSDDIKVNDYHCHTRTAESFTTGDDGILIESCTNVVIEDPDINDAPEHGIYVADNGNGVDANDSIIIKNPVVKNSGNNGIKFLGFQNDNVELINPTVIDSQSISGNGIGISLSNVNNGVVVSPSIRKDNLSTSSNTGMNVSICTNLKISDIYINETGGDGIIITGSDGTTNGASSDIYIDGAKITRTDDFADDQAIYIDLEENLSDIVIKDVRADGYRYGFQLIDNLATLANLEIIGGNYINNNFSLSYPDSLGGEVTLVNPMATGAGFACTVGSRWYDSTNEVWWEKWQNPTVTSASSRSVLRGARNETTASRPASGAGAGDWIFDNDLGKPIWWDGTNWVDATGTTV